MQEGPQSQGHWSGTLVPQCALRWQSSWWDPAYRGDFPVPSWSCDWGIGSQSARPHWGTLDSPRGWLRASLGKEPRAGGCWSTARQIVTAVSAVLQYHLAVTAAPGRQGQSCPGPQFTSRWGIAPGMGGGHSPPAPTWAADPSRGGQGDRPLPPASAPGTAGAQRPEQSPFVQVSPHPLLSLGRHPKPSRNRTQPGSAFESPQEGSAELPKEDEHPPFHTIEPVPSFSARYAGPGQAQS